MIAHRGFDTDIVASTGWATPVGEYIAFMFPAFLLCVTVVGGLTARQKYLLSRGKYGHVARVVGQKRVLGTCVGRRQCAELCAFHFIWNADTSDFQR